MKESRRVVKEQQNAKIRATSNLKRMRELERKYKDEEEDKTSSIESGRSESGMKI